MDLVHPQALKALLCGAGIVLAPLACTGQTAPLSPSLKVAKEPSDYLGDDIKEWEEKIERYRREGRPSSDIELREKGLKAMKAIRQFNMAEDQLRDRGLQWFDPPNNWSLQARLIKQTPTSVLVEVTTTNLTDGPRGLYSERPEILYRLVWKGHQPRPLVDPTQLPPPRKSVPQLYLESGYTIGETVNLAKFVKLEEGLEYTVEFRRTLDYSGLHPWSPNYKWTHWVAAAPITFVRQSQ